MSSESSVYQGTEPLIKSRLSPGPASLRRRGCLHVLNFAAEAQRQLGGTAPSRGTSSSTSGLADKLCATPARPARDLRSASPARHRVERGKMPAGDEGATGAALRRAVLSPTGCGCIGFQTPPPSGRAVQTCILKWLELNWLRMHISVSTKVGGPPLSIVQQSNVAERAAATARKALRL